MGLRNEIEALVRDDLDRLQERRVRSRRASSDPEDWLHETTYTFTDGGSVTVNTRFVDDLVLPAAPGREVVWFAPRATPIDEPLEQTLVALRDYVTEANLHRAPLIGWRWSQYDDRMEPLVEIQGIVWHEAYSAIQTGDTVRWLSPYRDHADGEQSLQHWLAGVRDRLCQEAEREAKEAEEDKRRNAPCSHCGRIDDDLPF